MSDEIDVFAEDLRQEILGRIAGDGAEQMRSEVFTEHLAELLIEDGELENAASTFHKARGVEVHGYGIDDGDTLNLIASHYTGEVPPVSITRTEVNTAMRRLRAFFDRCRDGAYHEELEPSSPAYDMAAAIHRAAPWIRRLRLIVATDARSAADQLSVVNGDGIEERRIVWDIVRLQRLDSSGREREPIEVNFVERFGSPLPCLSGPTDDEDYRAMLAVIPGEWLADIYELHGARLLELNVRSFLQAAGKVNRGIRDTLRTQPERFLAYNNGISATAAAVDLIDLQGGGKGIAAIRDLQIVNGGQTTASVHRAALANVDLTAVAVQAKITVAAPGRLEEIVPLISRYANSQNKVSEADLSANEPFHVEIEKQSRAAFTPVVESSPRQTHWFYERARGQYRDAAFGSQAEQRKFKLVNPADQRFSKTDLAKYEHAWDQLPDQVSRGAQKNFTAFMANLARRHVTVDRAYFEQIVAKAKLWRQTERLVSLQNFGGYRANIVAYAIAKLSHGTSQRLDLDGIWERQALTPATEQALVDLSHLAWDVLVEQAPAGTNITEWAKREECWQLMRAAPHTIDSTLAAELVSRASAASDDVGDAPQRDEMATRVAAIGGDGWTALANWARETGSLEAWQRKLSSDIARRLLSGRPPTAKQSQWASPILDEATELGFQP